MSTLKTARPDTLALLEGIAAPEVGDLRVDLVVAPPQYPDGRYSHSNAAGCRHSKRYQDVEELLRAGISVYTTVNVQHLESLNDLVASITHIAVSERIPDRFLTPRTR